MMTALLAAMLIPPPPDRMPPHVAGPGLLCEDGVERDGRAM